jgi:hypothetical protein
VIGDDDYFFFMSFALFCSLKIRQEKAARDDSKMEEVDELRIGRVMKSK